MPRRRRVLLATADASRVLELQHALSMYDVEVLIAPEDLPRDEAALRRALYQSGTDFWVKAVFWEETELLLAPESGSPHAAETATSGKAASASSTAPGIGRHQGLGAGPKPAVLRSRLLVHQLPAGVQKLVRESRTPLAAGADAAAAPELAVYEHELRGHLDLSRRKSGGQDAFVVGAAGLSLSELEALHGRKVSPFAAAASKWIIEKLHYPTRKSTNFIREGFAPLKATVSFREEDSVGAFVLRSSYLNTAAAARCGLRDAFVAVANHGAFFRSARTRRELNYWLPGLNAGIPLTAKRDPIHEITFAAHDFGHFLLPDLVYTGRCTQSRNYRRTYVVYRMMSEAVSCVLADMLFVETLREAGYEYDWTLRRIHPLYLATGVRPLEAETREAFLERLRALLEANVDYCLKGDATRYLDLIRANGALDAQPDPSRAFTASSALDGFKEKYMPFFVEDYRWTNRNFGDMEGRAAELRAWWALAEPLAAASGAGVAGSSGLGLETVEQFMAAIGVGADGDVSSDDLIRRVLDRVIETRLRPVFTGEEPLQLASERARRTQAFARYMIGQSVIFARFPHVPESRDYAQKVVGFLCDRLQTAGAEAIGENEVATVRGLYSDYVGILAERCLITPDDAANFTEICPLFEPSFAFYDESKAFYHQLDEVQREILGG